VKTVSGFSFSSKYFICHTPTLGKSSGKLIFLYFILHFSNTPLFTNYADGNHQSRINWQQDKPTGEDFVREKRKEPKGFEKAVLSFPLCHVSLALVSRNEYSIVEQNRFIE